MADYRRCAGTVLFNTQSLVWVGERIDTPGAWQLPQGGIDFDESPYAAALRELQEETNVANVELLGEAPGWFRYDLPEDLRVRAWGGDYRGQEQKWFAVRYLGADRDINIATESPEFRAWQWVSLECLPGLAVHFKRPIYDALVRAFACYAGSSMSP